MIGRLQGILLEKQPPHLLVDVKGVSYEVEVPMTTFYRLPELGHDIILYTHFVVREDAQLLYGFYSTTERSLFRALIKVNGIGPKLGLTILSGMETETFVACIQRDDIAALIKLPGVGKKTAERLLIEMRDRLKDWQHPFTPSGVHASLISSEQFANKVFQDAVSALVSLGYKPQEASRVVTHVNNEEGLASEELIRRALKSMVS